MSILLVYWFICTIKQDILQITILYHVESPVDVTIGQLYCLQHRVSVSRGDKKAAEWKELKQQSFPGMINSKPGARRYLLGPFPLQWASDTVEPCLYIVDIGGFLGNRQLRASNQTFLQIFHLIFLFQIPHYSSPGLWLFSDPNCHQNQDSKDKKLTKQVC